MDAVQRGKKPRGDLGIGRPLEWPIAEDYAIYGGYLVAAGARQETYRPRDCDRLADEFARIEYGDEKEILSFARGWGLVGLRNVAQKEWLSKGDDASTPDPSDLRLQYWLHWKGDPVELIWPHAFGVRLCLQLLFHLKEDDSVGILACIQELIDKGSSQGDFYTANAPKFIAQEDFMGAILLRLHYGKGSTSTTAHFSAEAKPITLARQIISTIVNDNLITLHPTLQRITGKGRLGPGYDFCAPLEVIYWHLRDLTASTEKVGQCKFCYRFFKKTHDRQEYCHPPRSAEIKAKRHGDVPPQSRCSNNYRQKAWQDKKKSEKKGQNNV